MSMSVRCDGCGLEYAGARGFGGVFADTRNARNPRFLRMLLEVKRFHRRARTVLETPEPDPARVLTLGEFLEDGRYSRYFAQHFMAPVVSCVWSCPPQTALAYPARSLFTFLDHHGALTVTGSPHWRTVVGGSRTYVERAAKELTATALSTPVRRLARTARGVEIRDDGDETRSFDHAVVATHADQALALLARPTRAEHDVLGAFGYSVNETILHTDGSGLPRHEHARASWNYHLAGCSGDAAAVQVSYDMNRLHRLDEPNQYVVTLNGGTQIRRRGRDRAHAVHASRVHARNRSRAQARLAELNDGTVAYAGAYHGWGFHEDGCASGVRAGGVARGDLVTAASLYRTRDPSRPGRAHPPRLRVPPRDVAGRRRRPPGCAAWLARVASASAPATTSAIPSVGIRANVDAFLAEHGADGSRRPRPPAHEPALASGTRSTRSPCSGATSPTASSGASSPRCTTPTANATATSCGPTPAGEARVDKAFYVSPFFDVDGRYDMRLSASRARSSTSRSRCAAARRAPCLHRHASRVGRAPGPVRSVVGAALRHPFGGLRVIARIRLQGIRLWLRRVPDRPPSRPSARGRPPGGPARADRRTMTAPLRSVADAAAARPRAVAPRRRRRPTGRSTPRIARSLFFRADREDADPRAASPTARSAARGGDDAPVMIAAPARRLLPPRRERRADRVRRVVHGRRLGRRRPRRRARALRRAPHQAGAGVDAAAAPPLRAAPTVGRGEHARRRAAEHRAPLRPVERPLRALPRRLDDVLVGAGSCQGDTLDDAQARKVDRLLDAVGVALGTRLLEIGTGWGSLAIRAARRGAKVTTLTLSQRAASSRPPAGRRAPASATASTCSCATTATSRASTTRSSASR